MSEFSKKVSKSKSRKPLCSKDFRDFLFDEKLREKSEKLKKKQSNAERNKKRKASKTKCFQGFFESSDQF